MAKKAPETVPRKALIVFRRTPPRIVKHTRAIYAQVRNVVGMVGAPLSRSGIRMVNRQMIVNIRPTMDFRPVRPPMISTVMKNSSINPISIGILLNSYTVAPYLPSSWVLTVSVTLSFFETGTP